MNSPLKKKVTRMNPDASLLFQPFRLGDLDLRLAAHRCPQCQLAPLKSDPD